MRKNTNLSLLIQTSEKKSLFSVFAKLLLQSDQASAQLEYPEQRHRSSGRDPYSARPQ